MIAHQTELLFLDGIGVIRDKMPFSTIFFYEIRLKEGSGLFQKQPAASGITGGSGGFFSVRFVHKLSYFLVKSHILLRKVIIFPVVRIEMFELSPEKRKKDLNAVF